MCNSEMRKELNNWADSVGVELQGLQPIHLFTKDVEDTREILVGEIFYALAVSTDRLHMIVYSERTAWRKNTAGDTGEACDEAYMVWGQI